MYYVFIFLCVISSPFSMFCSSDGEIEEIFDPEYINQEKKTSKLCLVGGGLSGLVSVGSLVSFFFSGNILNVLSPLGFWPAVILAPSGVAVCMCTSTISSICCLAEGYSKNRMIRRYLSKIKESPA